MKNVLLITTDQQRADSIGAYGNPVCRTPHLDALAASGTRYTMAHTQNPFCQPARATILTSTMPSTHGVTANGRDLPLEEERRAVSTAFGAAGYRTALFGKAHFASIFPMYPTGRVESAEGSARVPEDWFGPYFGFEHVEMILFGHNMRMAPILGSWNWCFGPPPMGLHYARHLYRDGDAQGGERLRLMGPEASGATYDKTQTWASSLPEEDHPTTWVADRAVSWLGDLEDDEPFFAWVSFTDPHHPFDPPAPWSGMYTAADVAECLPEIRPEEFDTKPGLHRVWSQGGGAGSPFEWANPGGAGLSPQQLATMIAGYYALVSQCDNAIGRVLAALEASGRAEDTLVIATTDHGEYLGDHQMIFKGPLHYDGLVRVPLIVAGPGVAAGAVCDDPVGTIDLAPTALAFALAEGTEAVPEHMEGAVLPGVAGTPLGTREHVLTEDDFDIVVEIPIRTLTTRHHRINRYEAIPGQGELYDLDEDPAEFVNRWDDPAYAALKSDLLATLSDVVNPNPKRSPKVGIVG